MTLAQPSPRQSEPPRLFDSFVVRGFFMILICMGGFLAWAALAPLDEGVVATGQVAVDSRRKTVQHLEGGIIGALHVREGDLVAGGDPLITLDATQARSSRDQVRARFLTTIGRLDRLNAERTSAPSIQFSDLLSTSNDPLVEQVREVQINLFNARRTQVQGQISVLEQRIAQLNDQIAGLEAQRTAAEAQTFLIRDEIGRYEQLSALQQIDVRNKLARERELAALEGQMGQNAAEIARVRVLIGETEIEILQVERAFQEAVASELIDAQELSLSLRDELIGLEDILARTQIFAPQAGQVLNLAVSTIGGVVPPGQALMEIVPLGDQLVLEAQVQPIDIDNVVSGMEVRARISAFSQRSSPELSGQVATVGADAVLDQATGLTYYPVRVTFTEEEFEKLVGLDVRPGMPAELFIRGGTRTPLDYLLEPLTTVVRRALREAS